MKTSLRRLVIDSATKYLYVGLFKGFECLYEYYEKGQNDHSVTLMPQIEEGLGHLGWNVNDLDEIYVGVGPGSYTGLRIGVVVAKMFGWNSQIPVFQVSSLALMASSVDQEGLILPEIDARRGNSFLGLYDLCEGILTIQETESLSHLEDYKKGLKKPFTQVSEGKPNMQRIIESKMFHPVEDIHSLHPNYLRQTEAERNLKNS